MDVVLQSLTTVSLGLYDDGNAYLEALAVHQMVEQERALEIISSVSCSKSVAELVFGTLADLGLVSDASFEDLIAAAKARGYEICPPEVAPALCLQFPLDVAGWFVIGTLPLIDSKGNERWFIVGKHKGRPMIRAQKVPRNGWSKDKRFVFMKRMTVP